MAAVVRTVRFVVTEEMAAGGAYTTLRDLDRWMRADPVAELAARYPWVTVEDAEPVLAGKVLGFTHECVQVMSDVWEYQSRVELYLGWDEGYKMVSENGYGVIENAPQYNATYFRPEQVGTVYEYKCVLWTPDASDETREEYAAWQEEQARKRAVASRAKQLATWVREQAQSEKTVRGGVDVRVVKGRKVKKGTVARCTYAGTGTWGPFANLKEANGAEHKFVSTENLEVIPDWNYRFSRATEFGLPDDVKALLRAWAAGEMPWGILCDRVADLDADDYAGHEFAEYLRQYE